MSLESFSGDPGRQSFGGGQIRPMRAEAGDCVQ
jgi:hypothetical protein